MKRNYLNSWLALLFIALLLTGCKKDDESPSSKVTYDGKSYALMIGQYYSDEWEDGGTYDIELMLKGEATMTNYNIPYVYFYLESTSPELPVGEYAYNEEGGNMTWSYGYFYTLMEDVDVDIISGTIKISKSGSTYTVTFTGKDSDDKSISISYTGAITDDYFD